MKNGEKKVKKSKRGLKGKSKENQGKNLKFATAEHGEALREAWGGGARRARCSSTRGQTPFFGLRTCKISPEIGPNRKKTDKRTRLRELGGHERAAHTAAGLVA